MIQIKKSLIIMLTVLLIFLTSCAGVGDWTFPLPNGYEVWHINSEKITVEYCGNGKSDAEIPSFVKEFAFDSRYVFTRNAPEKSSSDEYYYILDTLEHRLYGPFKNTDNFEHAASSLGISVPTHWYKTSGDPNYNKDLT